MNPFGRFALMTVAGLAAVPVVVKAEPATYDSPEAAATAVIAAVEAGDAAALLAVFGEENEDVAFSGNDARDREVWSRFLGEYRLRHRIETTGPDTALLHVGREDWPFPAPIVKRPAGWAFDADAAREEVINRRIGLNELDVIDLLKAGIGVQAQYRQTDHDGDGVMEFAASILSNEGKRDGLYWPEEPRTESSPLGGFMARASDQGFSLDGEDAASEPYLGYYYRILQQQGTAAPGGAYSYMVGDNMVAGNAILAYPADYGATGIMTFMIGENGTVWEADLGEDTLDKAAAIDSFDPGEGWAKVE